MSRAERAPPADTTGRNTPPPECLKGEKIDIFHEFVVTDEIARCGAGGVTWGLSGGLTIGLPPVLRFGSKELKDRV